jgi:GNAT superfamily N-acetyltransferase
MADGCLAPQCFGVRGVDRPRRAACRPGASGWAVTLEGRVARGQAEGPLSATATAMSTPLTSRAMTRWLSSLLKPRAAGLQPVATQDLLPSEVAERFLDDPDHYLRASVGADDVQLDRGGRSVFAFDVRVAGHVIAVVRGGTVSIAADGETTAELAHFAITGPYRRLGLGAAVARALFRWLHRRFKVTRLLFVLPALREQRVAFRAFAKRIGAEPCGHFADDPTSPPLFAWPLRRAVAS